MDKIKINQKAVDFQEYLSERLKNPRFKKYYDEHGKQLEIASVFKRSLKIEFVK